ncbi:DUF1015 family protein [Collinsella sp. An2]|uniref:DUF1015 domain-containing protein n=1 Tax=Collinsella sp. An2 TaxID=1965585 RepID=UPI000B399865|nr:DUF1015 family protein [Collinsella sp. An2]OUP08435.1 hypothetical protein B5F33_06960 [Collinsella sp. An2]
MKVLPFPCTRPAPEVAADVAALPYDVFDRAEAAAYVEGHPLSFLNIDRPETQFAPDQDMYAPEVYAKASELLQERIADHTFLQDGARSYYLYELAWNGHVQTGLVGICSIDEYENGTIKRHELTREEKERDRIEHIRALGYQTGPIFLTYRDQPVLDIIIGAAKSATPLYHFADADVEQTVWEIKRPDAVEAIHAMFQQIPCAYIADGHHRAASAVKVGLELRREAQAAGTFTGKEPFNYFLSVLFPASQLTVLPYNRIVADRSGLTPDELIGRVREAGFHVEESAGAVTPATHGEFGMFTDGRWWRLSLADDLAAAIAEGSKDDPVAGLDVTVLQNYLLEPIMGIGDPRCDPRIDFVGGIRGTAELERRAGADGVAFSLHATDIDELMAVADAGLLMPPKSTWFEPKLRSGLFLHRIAR